jgi:cold shock CspA family protein
LRNARLNKQQLCVDTTLEIAHSDQGDDALKPQAIRTDDGSEKKTLADNEAYHSDSTAVDESASTGSEVKWDDDDAEEVQDSNAAGFDGMWGPACINKDVLTWNEGERVPISIRSDRRFFMNYAGKYSLAILGDDGKLHWDDGDVWTRQDTSLHVAVYPPWRRGTSCAYLLLPALSSKSEIATESHEDRGELMGENLKAKAPWRCSTSKNKLAKHHHESEQCRRQAMPTVSEASIATALPEATHLDCDAHQAIAPPTNLQTDEVIGTFPKLKQTNLPPWLRITSRRSLTEKVEKSSSKPEVTSGRQEREKAQVHTKRVTSFAEALSLPATPAKRMQEAETLDQKPQNTNQHESTSTSIPRQQEQVQSQAAIAANASPEQSKQPRGKCVIVSAPSSSKRYDGFVKYFRGTFGRIESAEVVKQYPDSDVFVHINDCGFRPRQWDKVSFQLAEDHNGNPKAVRVSAWKEPSHIDARDWFASNREGKKKLLASLNQSSS